MAGSLYLKSLSVKLTFMWKETGERFLYFCDYHTIHAVLTSFSIIFLSIISHPHHLLLLTVIPWPIWLNCHSLEPICEFNITLWINRTILPKLVSCLWARLVSIWSTNNSNLFWDESWAKLNTIFFTSRAEGTKVGSFELMGKSSQAGSSGLVNTRFYFLSFWTYFY